ncbi:MAG TPA: hypothetical protein VFF51_06730 [Candidatus Methylomirabilis sp.]|nr:hypothetical protein [Candidatus Methylomirabilis sp.]
MSMGNRTGVWRGVILVLGGLLMSCGTKQEGQTIGPPTDTVEQVRQWPQGLEPAGDFRSVDMPPEASKNLVEASADSAGSRDFFHTLRRQ